MIYTYPERKKYSYVINTTKGPLEIKLQQATANETKDFLELLDSIGEGNIIDNVEKIEKLNKYYIGLIKKGIERGKWRQIRQKWNKMQLRLLVKKELGSYIDEVIEYTHPTRQSVYEGQQIPKIDGKKPRGSIFQNEKEVIYEKTGIPANRIYDELTMEQIGRYIDKIIFNNYELFDEGKEINDKLMRGTKVGGLSEEDKADLEFIKSQKL